MHGYELYQQIQAEGIDSWFAISAAGVYYSLGKLREQGWVAESRQRDGRSARKSIYRLTEKGRATFFQVMEAELASREKTYLDYDVAIYLLNRIPLQRAVPRLEERHAFLAGETREVEATLADERGDNGSPLKLAILDHKHRLLEMEQNWLAEVISGIQGDGRPHLPQEEAQPGLMVLSGDLRHYHLPDLVRLIVSGQHSGTLKVTDGGEIRTLGFKEGQPLCAAHLRRGEPATPLTSCEEVLDGLCEVFRWREGRFTFDQNLNCQDWSVAVDCTAEELILRGCRKVDNWTIIERLVPSADTIFELGAGSAQLDQLGLTSTEQQVATVVDGTKPVAEIARELDLTLFEASRVFYCLAAIGVLRAADPDKIRLRRVFRELAELVCYSTIPWRSSPDDRSCEEEVNRRVELLPIRLRNGRVEDQADPQLGTDELKEIYYTFLQRQYRVISQRFGRSNALQSFEQALRQLAPELQSVAKRYGFDRISSEEVVR
jgi:DNA-binding PadR family transcriptional regulator